MPIAHRRDGSLPHRPLHYAQSKNPKHHTDPLWMRPAEEMWRLDLEHLEAIH